MPPSLHSAAEQAYAFFHQKEKVYVHSTSEREMDHIEECISSYVNTAGSEHFVGSPQSSRRRSLAAAEPRNARLRCHILPGEG